MGTWEEGDHGQGCLSQIPGNPSLLPAFLGWNWADMEQEKGPRWLHEELGIWEFSLEFPGQVEFLG